MAFPKIGGIGRSDGTDFWRGEFSELRRERPGDGWGFPPGLEAMGELHVEFSGMKNGAYIATGDVKDAAGPALGVGPGNVDAVGSEKAGEAVGVLDRGDLILTESEFGFFAAVTDAIGAEEEVADVPVGVAFVETRCSGGREADVDAAPGFSLNAFRSEFCVESGLKLAVSKARGIVSQEKKSEERRG